MARTIRRNFNREVGEALASIFAAHAEEELTLRDVSRLAVPALDVGMLDGIREEAIVAFVGHILRSQQFKDKHGDHVRRFHSYKKFAQTEDGKERQLDLWKPIEMMDRAAMLASAKARQQQLRKGARKLAVDVRFWDEQVAPTIGARRISKQLGLGDIQ